MTRSIIRFFLLFFTICFPPVGCTAQKPEQESPCMSEFEAKSTLARLNEAIDRKRDFSSLYNRKSLVAAPYLASFQGVQHGSVDEKFRWVSDFLLSAKDYYRTTDVSPLEYYFSATNKSDPNYIDPMQLKKFSSQKDQCIFRIEFVQAAKYCKEGRFLRISGYLTKPEGAIFLGQLALTSLECE